MEEQNLSISSFKRFLLKILLPLILVVSVAGVIIDHFFEQKIVLGSELNGAYKVNRILKETHADEVPIFGSSRAEGGFIPDSLGHDMFNYGLAGTKYDVTLFFLEEELKKHKNRPWILLNLDLEGLQYGLGDIANYIADVNYYSVQQLMDDERENKLYYRIPFIKYYGRFENYTRKYLNDRIQLTKFSDKGAALEKNALPPEEFDKLIIERKKSVTTFLADSALRAKLFSFFTAYPGRRFIFVVAPYHSSYFEQYKSMPEATAFLDALRSYSNVKVLDFSRMPLDNELFFNTSHVNYKGAILFNRVLRDSLNTMGFH